jgi:hypothetical protein
VAASDKQPTLDERPPPTEPPSFLTDKHIADELQLLENWLADLEQAIPSWRRRVADLRQALEPSEQQAA